MSESSSREPAIQETSKTSIEFFYNNTTLVLDAAMARAPAEL